VVLAYHRIAELKDYAFRLAVSPERFSEHLRIISERYRPTSLQELADSLREGRIAPRTVVLTFDDGYRDAVQHGVPLLERYGVPATFFILTGQMGSSREFWWDEVERLFREAEAVTVRRWRQLWRSGDGDLEPAFPNGGMDMLSAIVASLKRIPKGRRDAVIQDLYDAAGMSRVARRGFEPVSSDEVRTLAGSAWIDIGSHGVSHTAANALSQEDLERELHDSKALLEELTGQKVGPFAFPFGGSEEPIRETGRLARAAGYDVACTTFHHRVDGGTWPWALPRFLVHDWSPDELSWRLAEFFLMADRTVRKGAKA